MTTELDRILAISDPFTQLHAATERMADAQREVTELARLRRRLVQDLRDQGMSYAAIAEKAGLTRGRIHQIRQAGPGPEAALLGAGAVVIVTPLKQEAVRSRPVVAVEDVAVAGAIESLARTYRLETSQEHVPVGGGIDLNRPNLVVVCGPRLSSPVAEVLAQDSAYAFERASDGVWTLVDRASGTIYRSGEDEEPAQPYDIAYLGRLPRPDGRGLVTVFTGIHPAGSLGVARYLTDDLADLYAKVRDKPYSLLIRADHDEAGKVTAVRAMTPIRLHDKA